MFLGEHDFSSFRSSSCNSKNPNKNISYVDVESVNNFIIITIAANAFLQNMVRIMVGTLIDIAKNEKKMSITDIIDKKDRDYAGKTAPAHGLFFLGPKYKDEFDIDTFELNILDRLKY
jgi:tRNA pseudouridine38-40 synthase